jgi:hypothetical protein
MRHLNVLWRGAYIRQAWLDDTWWELARARHVHVERVQSAGGVAVYVAKYVTKDPTAARGVWYSAGWLGAGDIGMVARACRDRRAWSVWRGFLGGDAVAIDQVEDVKAALLEGIHRWRITGIATTT